MSPPGRDTRPRGARAAALAASLWAIAGCGEQGLRFVVFGDTQPPYNSCAGPEARPELLAVPRAIAELAPRFALHVGDLVDVGRYPDAYYSFVRCYEGLLARAPLFPTMGNHEIDWNLGAQNYRAYLQQQLFSFNPAAYGDGYAQDFYIQYGDDPTAYSTSPEHPSHLQEVPSGFSFKTFYTFRHENLYFISMEVGTSLEINTPLPWLEGHLRAARADPAVDHVIVFLHHPIYSSLGREEDELDAVGPIRRAYEPLLRQYDVTLVFSGHVHGYERFFVPDDGRPTRAAAPPERYDLDGAAVHYVVVGPSGAGFLPYDCDPVQPERQEKSYSYTQGRRCGHNFALVEVRGAELAVTILGLSGRASRYRAEVWDQFFLGP